MADQHKQWLHRLQMYLKQNNSYLTLPDWHHEYIFQSFEKLEHVEFSVHVDQEGYTVRFVLRGRMKQYLHKVCDDLSEIVHDIQRVSDEIYPFQRDQKDRATVVYKSNHQATDDEFPQIMVVLNVFWQYFVPNRENFRHGVQPSKP